MKLSTPPNTSFTINELVEMYQRMHSETMFLCYMVERTIKRREVNRSLHFFPDVVGNQIRDFLRSISSWLKMLVPMTARFRCGSWNGMKVIIEILLLVGFIPPVVSRFSSRRLAHMMI
jgi:hypothetical protein